MLDHAGVLLGQRLAGVEQHDGDLGLLQRGLGAQRGVEVRALGLVHPPPDAGGVDEPPRPAAELDELVDRVAGGPGDRVDDDPLASGQRVEQAATCPRWAARAAPPGAARPGAPGDRRRRRQRGQHGVQQVAAPAAVQRGDRVRLAQPERPQRRGVGLAAQVVDLVRGQHDRLAGAAQQPDHGLVGVGGADGRVDDEQHGVGQLDGDLGLLGDPGRQPADVALPAAGVDDDEPAPGPVASYATRSRVTPGTSSTTASRRPRMRLTSVDLPTFGRPTTASTGSGPASGVTASPARAGQQRAVVLGELVPSRPARSAPPQFAVSRR